MTINLKRNPAISEIPKRTKEIRNPKKYLNKQNFNKNSKNSPIVSFSNAIIHKRTMMIKNFNTVSTITKNS